MRMRRERGVDEGKEELDTLFFFFFVLLYSNFAGHTIGNL